MHYRVLPGRVKEKPSLQIMKPDLKIMDAAFLLKSLFTNVRQGLPAKAIRPPSSRE